LARARAELKAAKAVAGGSPADEAAQTLAELKLGINKIAGQVVRIGGDAPVAMAALVDWIARSCLCRAITRTAVADHKIVDLAALHADGIATLDVYPLICDLPAVKDYDPEKERALRAERAAASKAMKAAAATRRAKEGEGAAPSSEPNDGEEGPAPASSFHTYVDNAMKKVIKDNGFGQVRVSLRLREVVSDIIAEFVARFSKVAKISVLDLLGVRTLNAARLLALVKTVYVLKTGAEDNEDLLAIIGYVTAKVALYYDHLKAEKTRRWEEMPESKKTELLARKEASLGLKKKRDAELAKKRAIEMAMKAKELHLGTQGAPALIPVEM
jgi:hypothetical protein